MAVKVRIKKAGCHSVQSRRNTGFGFFTDEALPIVSLSRYLVGRALGHIDASGAERKPGSAAVRAK